MGNVTQAVTQAVGKLATNKNMREALLGALELSDADAEARRIASLRIPATNSLVDLLLVQAVRATLSGSNEYAMASARQAAGWAAAFAIPPFYIAPGYLRASKSEKDQIRRAAHAAYNRAFIAGSAT